MLLRRHCNTGRVIIFFGSRSYRHTCISNLLLVLHVLCDSETYNILTLARRLVRTKKVANATTRRPHKCLLVKHLNRCKLRRVKLGCDPWDLLTTSGWNSRNYSLLLLRLRLHVRWKYLPLWLIDSLLAHVRNLIVPNCIQLVVDPLGWLAISFAAMAGNSRGRALLLWKTTFIVWLG